MAASVGTMVCGVRTNRGSSKSVRRRRNEWLTAGCVRPSRSARCREAAQVPDGEKDAQQVEVGKAAGGAAIRRVHGIHYWCEFDAGAGRFYREGKSFNLYALPRSAR